MARLILLAAVVLAILMFLGILARAIEPVRQAAGPIGKGASVSDTFKTAAYLLLILLMLGVVTGWLGGL